MKIINGEKRGRRTDQPKDGADLKLTRVAVILSLAAVSHAAGPENAHPVDATGWWECDRGYVMQSRPGGGVCVPESEVSRERFIVSEVPSAGDGSLQPSGSARSTWWEPTAGVAPGAPAPASSGLFIHTSAPVDRRSRRGREPVDGNRGAGVAAGALSALREVTAKGASP